MALRKGRAQPEVTQLGLEGQNLSKEQQGF